MFFFFLFVRHIKINRKAPLTICNRCSFRIAKVLKLQCYACSIEMLSNKHSYVNDIIVAQTLFVQFVLDRFSYLRFKQLRYYALRNILHRNTLQTFRSWRCLYLWQNVIICQTEE